MTSGSKWIWHPQWLEGANESSAGGFVHFWKSIAVGELPTKPIRIQITADTRYKLYINSKLVTYGPVKGDEHMWFYDEIDIQPYLKQGTNHIGVRVLRFYFASQYATSFPRLPSPGLLIRSVDQDDIGCTVQSNSSWKTALDLATRLRIDLPEDDFLHVYEDVNNEISANDRWLPAKELEFPVSHGISAPWKLSPRLIPSSRQEQKQFTAIHNLQSPVPQSEWKQALLHSKMPLCLPAGTTHHIELEVEHHMTAFLDFKFRNPQQSGSVMRVTYSECFEDDPEQIPYIRVKGQRRDTRKKLIGPEDRYSFTASKSTLDLKYHDQLDQEIFSPFHFRTFRFLALDIQVSKESDLTMDGIDITMTNYPLDIIAEFNIPPEQAEKESISDLWKTSIRTLQNCMHDCYEDCPFYEQLQYAMDIRSSALFTYCVAGDDRMARQAIIQLHNSYRPSLGLTASRAPAHQYQIIPHFSLYWICMITDHFEYFGDASFVRQFMAVCDGVLESFARRIDPKLGLIRGSDSSTHWDFVDWTTPWKPMGIPPAAERTGFSSYSSMLYAYTLKRIADLLVAINRPGLAEDYRARAATIIQAVIAHCFNGSYFTDGLAEEHEASTDLSQHSQIWAVLCGAIEGHEARKLLSKSLTSPRFTPVSISMAFYALRALSLAGGTLYDDHFHHFWAPWKAQLGLGLTTWVEDNVTQRSDCHAWGSVPLYEFLAEVAGITPARGDEVVSFQPRVSLFPALDAKIPFCKGSRRGIAHVKWRKENGKTTVELEIVMEGFSVDDVLVWVRLPGEREEVLNGAEKIVLQI